MGNCQSGFGENLCRDKEAERKRKELQELEKQQNDAAIKIQTNFRAKDAKVKVQAMREEKIIAQKEARRRAHFPASTYGTQLTDFPSYSNAKTLEAEKRYGAYIYDSFMEQSSMVDLDPYQLSNDIVYKGQWREGQRVGKGRQVWSDGAIYEGRWRNNQPNGKGRLIHADGDVYIGEWKDNKAHGFGKYIHDDGRYYEGEWANDKQNGKGVEVWPDGVRYEGEYKDGKKTGKGKLTNTDGSHYEGNFQDDFFEGKGVYVWADGRRYEGDWKKSNMEGYGVWKSRDGQKYEGEHKNGKKDGYGIYTWADGKKFEGEWKEGKQNGKGFYIFPEEPGKKKEGVWENGVRTKWDIDSKDIAGFESPQIESPEKVQTKEEQAAPKSLQQLLQDTKNVEPSHHHAESGKGSRILDNGYIQDNSKSQLNPNNERNYEIQNSVLSGNAGNNNSQIPNQETLVA